MPGRLTVLAYLDANAVGHLVPRDDTPEARDRRGRLIAAVREGRLEIVASVILLQELAAIGAANWPAHQRVFGYLRHIASARLLRDTPDLVRCELRARHALRRSVARMGRAVSDAVWAQAMDRSKVEEITRLAQAETDQFIVDERRLRKHAARELRAVTSAEEAVEPNVWLWWSTDPAERVRVFAEETARAHGVELARGECARLPAFWRFHAYKVARIALVHSRREGGGLKATDAADAHHYAAAGYADVLVSDDGALHLTVEAIPRLPRPIRLADFARIYLGE